jgi:hypothetical protein
VRYPVLVGTPDPTAGEGQSLGFSEIGFAAPECLLDPPSLGDIGDRTDHFEQASLGTHYRMTNGAHVFHTSVRQDYPEASICFMNYPFVSLKFR